MIKLIDILLEKKHKFTLTQVERANPPHSISVYEGNYRGVYISMEGYGHNAYKAWLGNPINKAYTSKGKSVMIIYIQHIIDKHFDS